MQDEPSLSAANRCRPILVIDTAMRPGFVGVWDGERWSSRQDFSDARRQGEEIFALIGDVLAETVPDSNSWALSGVGAVAVATGPGSFSGVRIGLSAAKSIAETTGLPLVGVSLLDAAANTQPGKVRLVTMPASRGDVYFALYQRNGTLIGAPGTARLSSIVLPSGEDRPQVWIHAGESSSELRQQSLCMGSPASSGMGDTDTPHLGDMPLPIQGNLIGVSQWIQLADPIAHEAWRRASTCSFDDPLRLDALYVRRDDADGAWSDAEAGSSRITVPPFNPGSSG